MIGSLSQRSSNLIHGGGAKHKSLSCFVVDNGLRLFSFVDFNWGSSPVELSLQLRRQPPEPKVIDCNW